MILLVTPNVPGRADPAARRLAYGNLDLNPIKEVEDFSQDDEELVYDASKAAVAIENACPTSVGDDWSAQLQSLTEIGNALVSELDLPRLLDLIARRPPCSS